MTVELFLENQFQGKQETPVTIEWVDHRVISQQIMLALAQVEGAYPQDSQTQNTMLAEVQKWIGTPSEEDSIAMKLLFKSISTAARQVFGDGSLANRQFGQRLELPSEDRALLIAATVLGVHQSSEIGDWKQSALFQVAQNLAIPFERVEKHEGGGFTTILGLLAKLPLPGVKGELEEAKKNVHEETARLRQIWNDVSSHKTALDHQVRQKLISTIRNSQPGKILYLQTILSELASNPPLTTKTIQGPLSQAQQLLQALVTAAGINESTEQGNQQPFMTPLGKVFLIHDRKSLCDPVKLPETQRDITSVLIESASRLKELDFAGLWNKDPDALDQLRRRMIIMEALKTQMSRKSDADGFFKDMVEARRKEVIQGKRRWQDTFQYWDLRPQAIARNIQLVTSSNRSPADLETALLGESFAAGMAIINELKDINRQGKALAQTIAEGASHLRNDPQTIRKEELGRDYILWHLLGIEMPKYPVTATRLNDHAIALLEQVVLTKPNFLDLASANSALNNMSQGEKMNSSGWYFKEAYLGFKTYLETVL